MCLCVSVHKLAMISAACREHSGPLKTATSVGENKAENVVEAGPICAVLTWLIPLSVVALRNSAILGANGLQKLIRKCIRSR